MWVELPKAFDTVRLNRELRDSHIEITVGSLFSASGKYRNCLRLSFAVTLDDRVEQALAKVGEAVERVIAACTGEHSPQSMQYEILLAK